MTWVYKFRIVSNLRQEDWEDRPTLIASIAICESNSQPFFFPLGVYLEPELVLVRFRDHTRVRSDDRVT